MKHAYLLRNSMNAGSMSGYNKFQPEIDDVTIAKLSGGRLSNDEIAALPKNPTMILTHSFQCKVVPEVFGYLASRKFVTPKMRAFLDHLEPGVHRYFPIQLCSEVAIDGKTEHGQHFLLIAPPLIDCLVIEQTAFAKGYGLEGWSRGKDGVGGGGLSSQPEQDCTLQRSAVEGRHLWRIKVGNNLHEFACSDEFWDATKDEFQIWEPETKCILK